MKRYFGILFCFFVAITAHVSCTSPNATGGSTSTDNGRIVGKIYQENGLSAPNTQVTLRPVDFDPYQDNYKLQIDTTDQAGNYTFTKVAHGIYTLEAVDLNTRSRALVNSVVVDSISAYPPVAILAKPGIIKVQLNDSTVAESYLYIPGTSIFSMINTRTVVIDSVPAGTIPSLCFKTKKNSTPRILRYDIMVQSGQIATVLNPDWSHAKRICFNTTPSGADITGSVTAFPVLIRLTAANFDFTQAKINGDDIRFAKSDTTFLPYEIERWDSVAKLAEVWVKVDTVYGNDSSQSITMYWGNPTATSVSNGAAVFDTANGFTAVWHLNTDCSDVTSGKHDGTNFGVTDTVGIIGGAKKFDGSSYIQVPGLLGTPQSITLSAWVHLDSTIIFSQDIVSLGDAVALRADRIAAPYYGTQGFFCSSVSASDTVFVFTNTGAFISKTGWRYLVYTVDGARHVQSMYIDGIFQCSTNDTNPINYSGLGSNTFLGTHGNKKTASYAFGCIDEARVCRVALSADWINLCYMNQKQQDALVRW